jgi:hypothetical protein
VDRHAPQPRRGGGDGKPAGPSRTLLGYLLMPRPKDLFKALLMPLTFGIGVLAGGGAQPGTLLRALVVLIALELLVYPSRYQWNDVRGFVADQQHPGKAGRGRLPGPIERARQNVLASCLVAVARLLVTAALVVVFPELHLGGVLAAVTLGVFGVAIAYETLRSVGTGRTGQAPAPLRPAVVLLWITVGAGYVVRGMTGLALAVDLGQRPALAVAATVTLWAFGVAFVTSRWALEATAFARIDAGRIRWQARAEQAREHLLGLVRWLPAEADPDSSDTAGWAPLRDRTSVFAPWNVAMLLAATAAGLTGCLLTGPASVTAAAVAALVGGVTAEGALVGTRWRKWAVVAGAVGLAAVLVVVASPQPVVEVLPWLAVMAAYASFSRQCRRDLGRRGDRVRSMLGRLLRPVGRLVVGQATWQAVATSNQLSRG